MSRRKTPSSGASSGGTRPPAVHVEARGLKPGPWVVITLLALALRGVLLLTGTGVLYPGDHDDFVRWGIQATDRGVLSLYSEAPARHPWQVWDGQQWVRGYRNFDRVCNYPPGSAWLLWLSGIVFKALSTDRLINTVTSHALFSFWSLAADFVTAAGMAALVWLFRSRAVALWTYALALFLPPFWWDSIIWAQMDTVLLAPAIWMVYFMIRQRWLVAGLLWGLALSLKPQGILFVPLWGYALFAAARFWRPVLGGVVALATLLLTALPFQLHSGWAWFQRSYYENLFSTYAHLTTLKAFNIWYLHLLVTDSLDARAIWLGLSRGAWGKLYLLLALLAGFALVVWRWRRDPRGYVLWSTLSLLFFIMLPTEVHERYIVVVLPFLGVLAALTWHVVPALVVMVILSMCQMTWPLWLGTKPGTWAEIRQAITRDYEQAVAQSPQPPAVSLAEVLRRAEANYWSARARTAPFEWLMTILALLSSAAIVLACLRLRPGAADSRSPPARRPHTSTAYAVRSSP